MPDVSGVTVVTNARVYYSTRAAADAPSVRHSLRPFAEGGTFQAKLARNARRDRRRVFVIARSASDEAIQTFATARWIASLALAMTYKNRLCSDCLKVESETSVREFRLRVFSYRHKIREVLSPQ
jgi:hypothetical protein